MLETWLEALGATIEVSLYDTVVHGDGTMGFARIGNLRLRYRWEGEIEIGWAPTFDRWFNSIDWTCDLPMSQAQLADILQQAEALGARLTDEETAFGQGRKIVPKS